MRTIVEVNATDEMGIVSLEREILPPMKMTSIVAVAGGGIYC